MLSPWIFVAFHIFVQDPVCGAVVLRVQSGGGQKHFGCAPSLDRYLVELWEDPHGEQGTLGRTHSIGVEQDGLPVWGESCRNRIRRVGRQSPDATPLGIGHEYVVVTVAVGSEGDERAIR